MILVICNSAGCGAQFRVIGDFREVDMLIGRSSEFYPNKYTCPSCMGPAVFALESQIDPRSLTNLRDLEAQELFRGMHGLGLPEEELCSIEVVTDMLLKERVKKVTGHQIPATQRFILEWIEFENGQKMYFGSSTHGAVVYRITKPMSHVEHVEQDGNQRT